MVIYKKVCVIGGGVSGLKAAHTLLHLADTRFSPADIVVLEAQNRLGGRIKTDTASSKLGASYDLGAAWFHDALTNSVLHESIADGSVNVATDGYFDDRDICWFASDADGKLDANGLKLERVLEDMEKFIEIHFLQSLDVADVSLQQMAALYLDKYGAFLTPEQKKYCARMLRALELWYGISHEKISGRYAVMSHQGRNFYNKLGFSFLIEKLSSQLTCDVLMGEQVVSIARDVPLRDYRHLVTTASGKEYGVDYLVVSVPHLILSLPSSSPHGITWTPDLPNPMREAIGKMHFGALGKVILEFDSVWWDPKEDRMSVLSDEVPEGIEPPVHSFQYPIYVVNYANVHPGVSSLVILTQSPVTDHLEANPEEAWPYLKPLLAKLQVKPMRDPVNVIVTDWTRNPFARGSYLALHVGDDPTEEIIHLSGEFDSCGLGQSSTIRFAGEHTIADGAGCVHGAYDSGTRAAKWILSHSQ